MELLKLQCSSCGDAMEIKPGLNRIRCRSCGMTYLIEKKDQNKGNRVPSSSALGDNPADVILIPLQSNIIKVSGISPLYDRNSPYSAGIECRYKGILYDSYYDERVQTLLSCLKLFACMVYATKETYTVEIGSLAVDPVLLYYTGSDYLAAEIPEGDEIKDLVESRKTYYTSSAHSYNILTKPQYAKTAYDKKKNEKNNRAFKTRLESFIKHYNIEYEDEVKYAKTSQETYFKHSLFGKSRKTYRYWTERYTERRLYIIMDEDKAKMFLSSEDIAGINKMSTNECIADMAAKLYNALSKEAKRQLDFRKSDDVVLSINEDMLHYNNTYDRHSYQFENIMFSNYGMKNIDSLEVRYYLTGLLIKNINNIISENGDNKWNITEIDFDGRYTKQNMKIELKMRPSIKAVGVYKSWV